MLHLPESRRPVLVNQVAVQRKLLPHQRRLVVAVKSGWLQPDLLEAGAQVVQGSPGAEML
jgi:hypothetical protein